MQAELHLRKSLPESAQRRRQDMIDRGIHEPDRKTPHLTLVSLLRHADGLGSLGERPPRFAQECLPNMGELNPPPGAVKESTPSSCSNLRICWLRGGWAMWSFAAARPKWSSSATLMK